MSPDQIEARQLARMILAVPEGWLARHLNEVDADISTARSMLIGLAADPNVDRETRDCATAALNALADEQNDRVRPVFDDD